MPQAPTLVIAGSPQAGLAPGPPQAPAPPSPRLFPAREGAEAAGTGPGSACRRPGEGTRAGPGPYFLTKPRSRLPSPRPSGLGSPRPRRGPFPASPPGERRAEAAGQGPARPVRCRGRGEAWPGPASRPRDANPGSYCETSHPGRC